MSDDRGIVYGDDGEPIYRDIAGRRNYFHRGKEYVHNWFTATEYASEMWKNSQKVFWQEMWEARHDPVAQDVTKSRVTAARRSYRDFVLSWYRALCLPIEPGKCVPNEVALLLAEEWDEKTTPPHPKSER